MLCISETYAIMRCLSLCVRVCLSGMFLDSVKMNKHMFKIFSPSGNQVILVFLYQTPWQYSDAPPPNGASNPGGVSRNRDSEPISGVTVCCQCCDQLDVINTAPPDHSPVVTEFVDGGRRRRNVYGKKPQRYAKDNRTAHLTACSDKSVAYVTNNKRLCSTFCTIIEWQTVSNLSLAVLIFAHILYLKPNISPWEHLGEYLNVVTESVLPTY